MISSNTLSTIFSKKRFTISCFFFLLTSSAFSQNLWRELSKVEYEKVYNEEYAANINYPIFSEDITKLEGTKVTVSGYVIPLEVGEDYFILSAFPFASCFFCGAAGPETVIEIYSAKPFKVTSDQRITLSGTLELNRSDLNHLMFKLRDAVLISD
ncbi:MAG: hypothetical protein AAF740_14565 [Bacteroidota bacterium]